MWMAGIYLTPRRGFIIMAASSRVASGRRQPPSAFLSSARKGVRQLIRLELKPNESLDKALRRFKKICDREGLTRDMRKHSYYEKPSEKNKRKDREREKERAKAIRVAEKKKNKARKARAKSLKKMASSAPRG